jgi:hypothetical protein
MTWNWESTCSACVFVGRQLGSGTPCPSHAGRWSADTFGAVHGQPSAYAAPCPTADLPWPFTPREYARLLLVRSRACEVRPLRTLELTHPRIWALALPALAAPVCSPCDWPSQRASRGVDE